MRDFGRQPARRLQLLLSLQELDRFLIHAALFVEKHLQTVTTDGHQHQDGHAQNIRLIGLIRELRFHPGDGSLG